MDVEGYADRLIAEALARGELDTPEGLGRPLGRLDNDPGWWVKEFLERESLPERFEQASRAVTDLTAAAISADGLPDARALLASANRAADDWNDGAPEDVRLPIRSEVWLLDRRAGRPARGPGAR